MLARVIQYRVSERVAETLLFLFCGKAAIESDRIGLTKWRPDRVEAFRTLFILDTYVNDHYIC
jgi:hypothetical protein